MKSKTLNRVPKNLIIDADGVFTDGKFYYTTEGKIMKKYGPDDADAISLIKDKMHIHVISADKRGFQITKKRMNDMKLEIDLVSTFERLSWIGQRYNPDETIYMGDGIYDALVFRYVAYSIAPANAFGYTKRYADYVTTAKGSEGAVAEAILHILEKFFHTPFDVFSHDFSKGSGNWDNGQNKK